MSIDQENPLENQHERSEGQFENPKPQNLDTPPNYGAPPTPPPFQAPPSFGQFGGLYGGQQNLPNATASLVLGILSIPACCFYGIFGIIFGIIAIILANGDIRKYQMNLGVFTEASYKNSKAGKICGIVGLSLSVLYMLFWVLIIVGIVANPSIFRHFGNF